MTSKTPRLWGFGIKMHFFIGEFEKIDTIDEDYSIECEGGNKDGATHCSSLPCTAPDVYQMFTKSIKIAHRANSTGYQGASGGNRNYDRILLVLNAIDHINY